MTGPTELADGTEQWGMRIGPPGTRGVGAAGGAGAEAQGPAGPRKFLVQGAALEIECGVSALAGPLDWALRRFLLPADKHWPPTVAPLSGAIQPYELEAVTRHLSPTARRLSEGPLTVSHDAGPLEVYAEDERFWLVDERWGMAEVNLLRGQWRSWVLPEPTIDLLHAGGAARPGWLDGSSADGGGPETEATRAAA